VRKISKAASLIDTPGPVRAYHLSPAPERSQIKFSRIARQPKTSDLVAGQLRRLILTGDLADGDQLPPETQLTIQFGVSRPTVREAFRILETEGLISVARGSRNGARVNAPRIETSARYTSFALRAAGATLSETYEAQLAFEPFAARLLAEQRRPEAMAELEARLVELEQLSEQSRDLERRVGLARYHLLIVKLTGNRTLIVMAEMLAKILETHQMLHEPSLKDLPKGMPEAKFRELGQKSIRKLLGLIRAGDADAAETHWRKHVRNSAAFWLTDSDPSKVIDIDD
jgi:DNA-binding FadR family transcriptional regulator